MKREPKRQPGFGPSQLFATVITIIIDIIFGKLLDYKWYEILVFSILVLAVVLLSIEFYHYLKLKKLTEYLGIVAIEQNIQNGTTTNDILLAMKDNFFLAGRGASRFLTASDFRSAMERIDSRRPARLLILSPDSDAPCILSSERGVNSQHISTIIRASLKTIAKINEENLSQPKIIVRYYSNPNFKPTFRIVSKDDNTLYVSFYKRRTTGEDSFQLVLEDNGNDNNLYIAFREYFDSLWELARDIDVLEVS